MEIIMTTFTDKKEQFKAMNNSAPLQDLKGNTIEIIGAVIYRDVDKKTEEEKEIVALKLLSGEYVGSVSNTVINCVESYIGTFGDITESNMMVAEVRTGKSKGGRDFLTLFLV